VQANSGSQANQAVFFGLLQPGDTIMGMSLAEGGHLTHGMALNMSGKWFKVVSYGLDADEAIDYDAMERLAHEHKPKLIIAGASAYSLRIDFERFARVARPSAPISWSTWRTTPASSPPASTPTRCRMPTWSPAPRTRACAARAAASC
jgi:glycine/serine hydroxymethyltransferase